MSRKNRTRFLDKDVFFMDQAMLNDLKIQENERFKEVYFRLKKRNKTI